MSIWMVRSDGGYLYDTFKEKNCVAIGWPSIAQLAVEGASRDDLIKAYSEKHPSESKQHISSSVSQVWRFINKIKKDDWVITYSPSNRTYLIGKITGNAEYHPEYEELNMLITRSTEWHQKEINRDDLSLETRNSLGAFRTIFELSDSATGEIFNFIDIKTHPQEKKGNSRSKENDDPTIFEDHFANIEDQAIERIKDSVNQLSWDDMQKLIAGILRAMGYKTQISPYGSDRGKDIVASPDGFGFEHPRIIVEVKHRENQIGSQDMRSFLGGRRTDDRGLYVSIGGFTKDARYEAERASIALTLWTLDDVVRTLVEYYENTDSETKRLVPLKRLYWLA